MRYMPPPPPLPQNIFTRFLYLFCHYFSRVKKKIVISLDRTISRDLAQDEVLRHGGMIVPTWFSSSAVSLCSSLILFSAFFNESYMPLGDKYAEGVILDIEKMWEESEPRTPLVGLLSMGSDPTAIYRENSPRKSD